MLKSPKFKVSYEIHANSEEIYWTKARWKTSWANTKVYISMSGIKALQLLPALLTARCFFLLNWFHFLLAAFLSRYPMTWASLISWGLQGNKGNPGFNSIASYNSLFGLSSRNTLDTCLALVAFLSCSLILKPEPYGRNCQFLLFVGVRT